MQAGLGHSRLQWFERSVWRLDTVASGLWEKKKGGWMRSAGSTARSTADPARLLRFVVESND